MNKKLDIKYLGVPNICFSLTKKNDDREKEYSKQRIKRGFDDSETWSVGDTIINFAIPRLERYVEITKDCLDEKEFTINCEKVIESFKLLSRNEGIRIFTDKERIIVDEGLKLFGEILEGLWW